MSAAGLDGVGILESTAADSRACWSATPEAMVSRLIRCVRSGPKRPLAARAGHGVAVDAGGRLEDLTSLGHGLTRDRRLLLFLNPAIEFSARLHVHAQQHLGVLGSAVLRALPQVEPGLVRVDPRLVRAVRNQVGLAGQPRNPEAVIHVGGQQRDERRGRIRRVADRNMQFVGRDDVQPWIAILPPELVTDGDDLDGVRRPLCVLDGGDHPSRTP